MQTPFVCHFWIENDGYWLYYTLFRVLTLIRFLHKHFCDKQILSPLSSNCQLGDITWTQNYELGNISIYFETPFNKLTYKLHSHVSKLIMAFKVKSDVSKSIILFPSYVSIFTISNSLLPLSSTFEMSFYVRNRRLYQTWSWEMMLFWNING